MQRHPDSQHRFGLEYNSGPERFADPEFGLPREVPKLEETLKAADKSNDGKLSREEYPQPGDFDTIDNDGFATQEEIRTNLRMRRND